MKNFEVRKTGSAKLPYQVWDVQMTRANASINYHARSSHKTEAAAAKACAHAEKMRIEGDAYRASQECYKK